MERERDERDAKRRALEDFYGGEVPQHVVDNVTMHDLDDEYHVHPFVD